jgi:hypothetical protein
VACADPSSVRNRTSNRAPPANNKQVATTSVDATAERVRTVHRDGDPMAEAEGFMPSV